MTAIVGRLASGKPCASGPRWRCNVIGCSHPRPAVLAMMAGQSTAAAWCPLAFALYRLGDLAQVCNEGAEMLLALAAILDSQQR
jgi:hypothetical protein